MFQLIDCTYSRGRTGPTINIYGRGEFGEPITRKVASFYPYLYVKETPEILSWISENSARLPIRQYVRTTRYLPNGYQQNETPVIKIFTIFPKDVPVLRDMLKNELGAEVYDADILFPRRYMTDCGIGGMQWIADDMSNVVKTDGIAPLRILTWDIEVLPPSGGGIPHATEDPIIIISIAFNTPYKGHKDLVLVAKPEPDYPLDHVTYMFNEQGVIQEFVRIIADYDPDIIGTFNGNAYDFDYIITRARHVGISLKLGRDFTDPMVSKFGEDIEVKIRGRVVCDMIILIKNNYSLHSYSLNAISKELLNDEKIDIKFGEMRKQWKSGNPKFIEYARKDSQLTMRLILELGLLDKYVALAQASGCLLQEVMNQGQGVMIERLIMRRFYLNGICFPLRPDSAEVMRRDSDPSNFVEGATVFEPTVGLHENGFIMDFASLYPSVMRAYNLCPTTYVKVPNANEEYFVAPNGAHFAKTVGIIPEILTELYNKRKEYKKAMRETDDPVEKMILDYKQYATKILLNSIYGYTGDKRSRFFEPAIANAVTAGGRQAIAITRETVESFSNEEYSLRVVSGDTDSVFVIVDTNTPKYKTPDGCRDIGNMISEAMKSKLPNPMSLSFETYIKRILILAKKRYVGWTYNETKSGWEDSMKYRGVEVRRRDWTRMTTSLLREVFETILKEEGGVEKALRLVEKAVDRIERAKKPSDDPELIPQLIMSKKLSKQSTDYKVTPVHAAVVNKMKERGEAIPSIGDRVGFLIVNLGTKKTTLSRRADSAEYVIRKDLPLDTKYYRDIQILGPVERIFGALGIDVEFLRGDKKQKSITDFFG